MGISGIVIAALRGGSGKTILSVGVIAALQRLGHVIAPFKKGPDYIDAGWLGLAAGRPCYNLDTFLIPPAVIAHAFARHASSADIAVIEGNRGLYDGIDTAGSTSTAELAKQLGLPVVLCIDCTKATRTMAAVVGGCRQFDPQVRIRAVVLNRVAGRRHETVLRDSIEKHCRIPVIGAIPKLDSRQFPERHMGLVPTAEHGWATRSVASAADMVDRYIDMQALLGICEKAAGITAGVSSRPTGDDFSPARTQIPKERPRVGVIRDSAFQFYYPENLAALADAGAQVVFTSPLRERRLPQIDALYIGGGFPETHAQALAENHAFRDRIRQLAADGLPIYAECGGLMYLSEALSLDERRYPMCGVLPVVFGLSAKPQGHGYTVVHVDRPNPYFDVGTQLKGHEFHYSRVLDWQGSDRDTVFCMQKGRGFQHARDGISFKHVLATYTHLHALGTPQWAPAVVRMAAVYRATKRKRAVA